MVYRIRAQWTGAPVNGPTVSTFYFDDTLGTQQDCADSVVDFLGNLDDLLTNQITWNLETEVETLDTVTGTLTDVATVSTGFGTGTATTEFLPTVTQGLIRWNTGQILNGRVVKGHMFVPGMLESQNDYGRPNAAILSAVETISDNFQTTAGVEFVIWSRTNGAAVTVLGSSMAPQWSYLSSRRD